MKSRYPTQHAYKYQSHPRPVEPEPLPPGPRRFALCLIGQPRTVAYCAPSLIEHVIQPYQPDVFIVSDSQGDNVLHLYQTNSSGVYWQQIYTQAYIWSEIGDRRWRYAKHSPETRPENDLSVMWKGWKCGEMVKEHEAEHGRYDVVMFSRFDVKFRHVQPIGAVAENTLYVPYVNALLSRPDPTGRHYGGYSTQLCWCSSRVAELLYDCYLWSDDYYNAVGEWHSERMLAWALETHGIQVQHVDIDMMIIRGTSEAPLAWNGKPLSDYPGRE